jgi:hypothetical protein
MTIPRQTRDKADHALSAQALAFYDAGCCVIPAAGDRPGATDTKQPWPDGAKWTRYQSARPSRDQVATWLGPGGYEGFGLVCGKASGGLEMFEFEGRAIRENQLAAYQDRLTDHGLLDVWKRIVNGYMEATPSGGMHTLFRVDGAANSSTKLARRPATEAELAANPGDKFKVLIETRGEGGFVVVAPSGGSTHPTGKPWQLGAGGPATIATISEDERDALYAVASLLNQEPPRFRQPESGRAGQQDGARPGDDFSARTRWKEILAPHGWEQVCDFGNGAWGWRRPGKDRGMSATTRDDGGLYVFSTSTDFDDKTPYTKFAAYAVLEHKGDFTAAAAELRRRGYGDEEEPAGEADTAGKAGEPARPKVKIGSGPATIRAVARLIDRRQLPGVYVSDGQIVHVEEVSGAAAAAAADEDSPLPVAASPVTAPGLARLLAEHTFTYQIKTRKDGEGQQQEYEAETTPSAQSLAAALARKTWAELSPLHGIVGAPVLRPDGSLLQEPGYDPATGLYLASKIPLDPVPAQPGRQQVEAARRFLFEKFLHDFPWVGEADLANYTGVLATPILRRYIRTLIPFVVFTATMPSSGKTILTSGPGMLYGQRVLTWSDDDAELRKVITSVLADPVGTIIFDNLAEGTVINSPVLARLITDRTWADRLLGGNKTAVHANDRLWAATGNNLRLGGDMATRTVLVCLDPNMPHPEERTGFAIPGLDDWILRPANQRKVLWSLLVLVVDWTRQGAPRQTGVTMRQFTPWAEAVGGFLAHHGVKGFLGNVEDVRGIDEEDAMWTAFLAKWHQLQGEDMLGEADWKTTHELRLAADIPLGLTDPWEGLFLTDDRGRLPSEVSLGKRLTGQINRFHGSFVLRSKYDQHNKVRTWHVEEFGK